VGNILGTATAAEETVAPMLNWEAWMNIKHLHKEGHSIKAITRLTGHSRNTVRRILRQAKPEAFKTPARSSCLDEFKPYVEQRYQECTSVGGLLAGYVGIPLNDPILHRGMNNRENPNDLAHGVPDINLNNQTVPYGSRIAMRGKAPTLIGPRIIDGAEYAKGLGTWIRNTLCTP
jgi:helix-turn-helix resolvase-like protein